MDRGEIEKRLEYILVKATGSLPADELADMIDLVRHGEPGIALENFCTQLDDHDSVVSDDVVGELRPLAAAMGMTLPPWIERAVDVHKTR